MRYALLLLAAVPGVSLPTVAATQTNDGTFDPMGSAINNTIAANLRRRGLDDQIPATLDATRSAYAQVAGGEFTTWFAWAAAAARNLALWPFRLFVGHPPDGYGGFNDSLQYGSGGAGATGDWDPIKTYTPECDDMEVEMRPDGRLWVTTIPLPGGGPLSEQKTPTPYIAGGPHGYHAADQRSSAVLYTLHNYNLSYGQNEGFWCGVVGVRGEEFIAYRIRLGDNALVKCAGTIPNPQVRYWRRINYGGSGDFSLPCPPSDGASDFDFYATEKNNEVNRWDSCTFYAKNLSISPSGYAYPTKTPLPNVGTAAVQEYIKSYVDLRGCKINPEAIMQLADGLFRKAASAPGYKGAPYEPIQKQDVRTAGPGADPTGNDMQKPPTGNASPPQQETPEPALPTDPGTNPSEPPGETAPIVLGPNLTPPALSMPDWFPGLPSLSIPTGSGQCPTWEFEAFETRHVFNHHCPFIDQNKAVISAIMILLFTLSAAIIVMRA
jgi:hypothetical protein